MNLPIIILNKLLGLGDNILSNGRYKLSYVTEGKAWVITEVGKEITNYSNELGLSKARITKSYFGLRNQIIHFGSVNTFLIKDGFRKPHKSNRLVLTWFHFVPEDKKNKNIIEAQKYLDIIHTSCNITKNNLIDLGVNPEKIVVIPLGVDLSLFRPVSFEEKQKIKKQLGIPSDKIVIGSFQKDGVGWGKGLEPKLIKGPDIFVRVVERLAKNYPIFILLVGPARGYAKLNLEKRNISYKNIGYLREFKEVVKYYNVLDLYVITSRIEGGPKTILEAMASGIPVVSTKVGMVPDIVDDSKEILITDIEDVAGLTKKVEQIIECKDFRGNLIKNSLLAVQNYSWDKVVQRYYNGIYSKLL